VLKPRIVMQIRTKFRLHSPPNLRLAKGSITGPLYTPMNWFTLKAARQTRTVRWLS